ncbi:phage tail sheath family protein [Ascidiimonas sp. W6]|uniref:phage tail sheath family protein n=1 Tax=Ascidiimonas meishanensis TaxID=3128903 RepID=UPI0030EE7466
MKTPGVYISELDAFGNAVVPIPTAVPAFIGYTGQTSYNGKSLLNKPVKVTSLAEFLAIFGTEPPEVKFKITASYLPEYQAAVDKSVTDTAAALKAANDAVTAAAANATKEQKDAAAAAKTANDAAKAEQTAVKADKNLKALTTAQAAMPTDGTAPTDAQLKALAAAQKTIDDVIHNAEFVIGGIAYDVETSSINYRMYGALKFFYENGGGSCYVISIGAYDYSKPAITDTDGFMKAITLLEKEMEPTMLVIPDLVEIKDPTASDVTDFSQYYKNAYSLQGAMINHCGKMMNRVAILDIPGAYSEPEVGKTSVSYFRDAVTPLDQKFNSYAAAYYPWLHTTVIQTSEVSYKNIDSKSYDSVLKMLTIEYTDKNGVFNEKIKPIIGVFDSKATPAPNQLQFEKSNTILQNLSKSYQMLVSAMMAQMNLMGPSAAMAGIYTSVDNNEGVWVAPANVGVQSTVAPSIKIDHQTQEDLNVPLDGKSISAIRAFTGRGNLVWGARTLDGNSNDWRYINVRRTLIFLEQSVKEAAKAYVFAPNDSSTWVNVESMISNFLNDIWKQGGLVGPKPADAFSVSVGLGSTMTGEDILMGIMRVAVKVAVSHPAEFISITFQQEMQKA